MDEFYYGAYWCVICRFRQYVGRYANTLRIAEPDPCLCCVERRRWMRKELREAYPKRVSLVNVEERCKCGGAKRDHFIGGYEWVTVSIRYCGKCEKLFLKLLDMERDVKLCRGLVNKLKRSFQ